VNEAGTAGASAAIPGSTSPGERVVALDILRGFAIAAVVGIHVAWFSTGGAEYGTAAGQALLVAYLCCAFGVPLFLALSASGLAERHSAPESFSGHLRFLARRAASLLPAYVVWSLVSAALFRPDVFASPWKIFVILGRGTADAQFYFVPLLFELYLFWPLLRPLARAAKTSRAAAVGVAALGFAVSVAWWFGSATYSVPQHWLWQPMYWLGFFTLGLAWPKNRGQTPGNGESASRLQNPKSQRAVTHPSVASGLRAPGFSRLHIVAWLALTVAVMWWEIAQIRALAPVYDETAVLMTVHLFRLPLAAYIVVTMLLLRSVAFSIAASNATGARLWGTLGRHSYGVFLVHLVVLRLVVWQVLPPASFERTSVASALVRVAIAWTACIAISAAAVAFVSRIPGLRRVVSNR
jgi:peptidoglycan/LPS O-acetylase OafA/YrhL